MSIQFKLLDVLETIDNLDYNNLVNFFKINFLNKIFVKKITSTLLLIHNNYNNGDLVDQELYNECKSIVIDISGKPEIVSYTHENIQYLLYNEYEKHININDIYEESFEGTLISIFFHNNKWNLTTNRCIDIDRSYFYNKNKTFGNMFDECLREYCDSINVRQEFLNSLDIDKCYHFVIVHYENKNLMDYTTRFGPQYKKLIHILTRDKKTQQDINIRLNCVDYPLIFDNYESALNELMKNNNIEAIIVKRKDMDTKKMHICKICSENFMIKKNKSPNYPNIWYSYLSIYQKNDNKFRIKDYQELKGITEEIIIGTKKVDITGMFFTLFKESSNMIYNLIINFTDFDFANNRFEKKKNDEFMILNNSECNTLKKQISIMQNLIIKKVIKNTNDIINHLRNHITVYNFVDMLYGIRFLLDKKMIKNSNKYYIKFINLLIEKIENN